MITFADMFSGCGGLSHGFYKHPDFKGLLAVDHWSEAEKVFKDNHPNIPFETADLYEQTEINSVTARLRDKCDILLGGPPCQAFSTLGKRKDNDKRSSLVEAYIQLCTGIRPKIIIMENVRGITSKKHHSGVSFPDLVKEKLSSGNSSAQYEVADILINTLDYGLAQTRTRFFIFAVRKDIENSRRILDNTISNIEGQKKSTVKSLKHVIGDLPKVESGQGAEVMSVEVNGRTKIIYNHRAMNHSERLLKRFSHVPPGGGLLDVPRRLLTNHLKKVLDGDYGNGGLIKNIYGRMEWDKPSGTIVAGIDKITCGRFVHPEANRLLTPRECARIQSFPDSFKFQGSLVTQYYLIGNAVPPAISKIIAKTISAVLGNQPYALEHKHSILENNHVREISVNP
ncbi:MAG TPA: DNA cytosine methyltransferase [Pyrinomonadaceae bacterium]|nr:DNA cytosine methyltransferase [Pyrinomonadaceae bacterium]